MKAKTLKLFVVVVFAAAVTLTAVLWVCLKENGGQEVKETPSSSSAPLPTGPLGPRLTKGTISGHSYHLFVPGSYRPDRAAPLIVSCHGTVPYDTAEFQMREWKAQAEEHGCLVACPELAGTDGLHGGVPTDSLTQDEQFILSVIAEISQRYRVDRQNTMITGYAGGGLPAYFVGLRHPEVFSVVAARSCNFNGMPAADQIPPQTRNTSVLIYWQQNDPGTVVAQSKAAVDHFTSAGLNVKSIVMPGIGHERRPEVAMKFFLDHLRPRSESGGK
jgi:poly(3-hydroxybutyrate) depolymerase